MISIKHDLLIIGFAVNDEGSDAAIHGMEGVVRHAWRVNPKTAIVSYDSMVAVSTNLFGPYGPRQCALRSGGHNGYFEDATGKLFAIVWCYPDHHAHWQKVSIAPIRIEAEAKQQPALLPADEP